MNKYGGNGPIIVFSSKLSEHYLDDANQHNAILRLPEQMAMLEFYEHIRHIDKSSSTVFLLQSE